MAHQIKQLFQYQEEKQRSDSWDGSSEDSQFGTRKKPLLATPSTQQGSLSDAEKSYYEHKAKLRRTQVQHQGNVWVEINESSIKKCQAVLYKEWQHLENGILCIVWCSVVKDIMTTPIIYIFYW